MATSLVTNPAEEVLTGDDLLFAQLAPEQPTSPCEIVEALRRIKLLEPLTDEELLWLATHGTERKAHAGTLVFHGGAPVHHMTILLLGEVHVRRTGGPVSFFIGRSGQVTGKLPFSRMKTFGGDGYAVGELWTLDFDESIFPQMLQAAPQLTQIIVSTLLDRTREVTRMEQQAEKLNALGKLAANLSHELNNPASAARSAANNLWTELRHYGDQKFKLGSLCFSAEDKKAYSAWIDSVRALLQPDGRPERAIDAVEISDREEQLTRWFKAKNIEDAWRIAPVLAETKIEIEHLDRLAAIMHGEALTVSLGAFASALQAERMTDAVMDSTRRIFELISAIKDYSYMDQAPIQEINVSQQLDSTLAMLGSRLGKVRVVREFAPDVPVISAYGGELNQVWTALLENALDAMALCNKQDAVLTLKTSLSGQTVLVEVCDNGPGIDPAIRSRIFEPFFTTKAVGQALGLGLDTANRLVTKHKGQLSVFDSTPGQTCLQVRLPIEQTGAY